MNNQYEIRLHSKEKMSVIYKSYLVNSYANPLEQNPSAFALVVVQRSQQNDQGSLRLETNIRSHTEVVIWLKSKG